MRKVEQKIESCSQQDVELHVERVIILSLTSHNILLHCSSHSHLNKETRFDLFLFIYLLACLPARTYSNTLGHS